MLTPTEHSAIMNAESVEFEIHITDSTVIAKMKELFGAPYEQWAEKLDIYNIVVDAIEAAHHNMIGGNQDD